MAKRRNREQGAEAFDAYYSEIYGPRWPELKGSLGAESRSVSFSPFGLAEYHLDLASIFAAACLPLRDSDSRILDMCAAPGGKTLVLASRMPEGARLFANERSGERKARLQKVCEQHIAPSVLERVTISCSDAASWCRRGQPPFDAILLDAPCSSERHVLCDPKYLALWTQSRVRSLCAAQWALLSCAWRLLAPGGRLLYATCALAPDENDRIISRLLKKFEGVGILARNCDAPPLDEGFAARFIAEPPEFERTEFGWIVLPDRARGAGPLYFSVAEKGRGNPMDGGDPACSWTQAR